jgi:hypothetical protein
MRSQLGFLVFEMFFKNLAAAASGEEKDLQK